MIASGVGELGRADVISELALLAEQAGWDGFFVTDHLMYRSTATARVVDPWTAVAAIAARTGTLHTGVLVCPLPRYRPWYVARHVIGLNQLAPGRIVLGVGLGSPVSADNRPFGDARGHAERAAAFVESLSVLRKLLAGEVVTADTHSLRLAGVRLTDVPVDLEIWCGTTWPGSGLERALRLCDGIFPEPVEGYFHQQEVEGLVTEMNALGFPATSGTLAVEVATEPGSSLLPFRDAGVSWALEYIGWRRGDLAALRERISQGPPLVGD